MRNTGLKAKELFSQGKTKTEIAQILECDYNTIRYHLNPDFKKEHNEIRNKKRREDRTRLKMEFGGKCIICNYNRCLDALHFHHPNQDKEKCVSHALHHGYEEGVREAKKCQLVCANCHSEIHSKL
jgi:hypothetical protein